MPPYYSKHLQQKNRLGLSSVNLCGFLQETSPASPKQVDKQVIALKASYGIMGNMSYSHSEQKNMGYNFCADFTEDYLQQASR